jgi:hypothetical protein
MRDFWVAWGLAGAAALTGCTDRGSEDDGAADTTAADGSADDGTPDDDGDDGTPGDDGDDGTPGDDDGAGTTGGDDGPDPDGTTGPDDGSDGDATGSGSDTDDGSATDTGSGDPLCDALMDVVLVDATAEPVDQAWTPGSVLRVVGTLAYTGRDENGFLKYPGIRVTADDATVVVTPTAENWLFAILPDQEVPIEVGFEAEADAAPGTEVSFTIEVAALNAACEGTDTETVSATITAP